MRKWLQLRSLLRCTRTHIYYLGCYCQPSTSQASAGGQVSKGERTPFSFKSLSKHFDNPRPKQNPKPPPPGKDVISAMFSLASPSWFSFLKPKCVSLNTPDGCLLLWAQKKNLFVSFLYNFTVYETLKRIQKSRS